MRDATRAMLHAARLDAARKVRDWYAERGFTVYGGVDDAALLRIIGEGDGPAVVAAPEVLHLRGMASPAASGALRDPLPESQYDRAIERINAEQRKWCKAALDAGAGMNYQDALEADLIAQGLAYAIVAIREARDGGEP